MPSDELPDEIDDTTDLHAPPPSEPITLGGYTLRPGYFLARDYEDISQAAAELPPVIDWVSHQLQSITEQLHRAEDGVKRSEAAAWFELLRGGFEDRGYSGKKTTHAVLMAVRLDPDVNRAQEDYAILSGWHVRLTNLMRALQAKLELVRSSEATKRSAFGSSVDKQ